MSRLNRRTALAAVASLPAMAIPAGVANAATDPIFAAIAKHRACIAVSAQKTETRAQIEASITEKPEILSHEAKQALFAAGQPIDYEGFIDGLTFKRLRAEVPEFDRAIKLQSEAFAAEWDAHQVLLDTAPITIAGAVAVLRHAVESKEHESYAGELWDEHDLLQLIGTVADGLARIQELR
jgi:hypothetical protein